MRRLNLYPGAEVIDPREKEINEQGLFERRGHLLENINHQLFMKIRLSIIYIL